MYVYNAMETFLIFWDENKHFLYMDIKNSYEAFKIMRKFVTWK